MKTLASGAPTTASTGTQGGPPVRHLRGQGSLLHKRSTYQHLTLVAAKGDIVETPYDRVTEAYGADNWPHLLHMLEDGDTVLRKRVLTAMISVFKLPQELTMCLKHGALEMIEQGILDPDSEISELSAQVLSVMLESSTGRTAYMESETVLRVVPLFTAASNARITQFLYDGFLSLTRSFIGAQLLTKSGYLSIIVGHLKRPGFNDELRLRVLQLLKNILNDGVEGTTFKAIDLESVELCAKYLYDDKYELRAAACDAIAVLGCVDKAKKITVDRKIVKKLCNLLTDGKWQVVAASAGALMILTIYDEAKRMVVASDGLQTINQLLMSSKYLLQLNAVKLMAVMASFPPARKQFNVSSTEYHLRTLMSDPDTLLARSAKTALHAVQWDP